MNNSDFKYPKYVTGIKDVYGEWIEGGYDYVTQAPGWTRIYLVNQFLRFNLGDYEWTVIEPGRQQSELITFFTFPNGYSIKGSFLQYPANPGVSTGFQANFNWYDLDGNAIGNLTNVYQGSASSSTAYPVNWGNLNDGTFTAYMHLRTVYGTNPVQDAPNDGICFTVWVGTAEYGFVLNEGQIQIPGVDQGRIGNDISMWFLDMENFTTYLHEHGNPWTGDEFSDEEIPGEPAGGDDTSGTGGGDGNYDDTSTPIDFPALPVGGALTSGMIKGFVMNSGNLIGLQSKLWDMNFFDIATQFQKLVNQPLDCFISLHCLPFTPTEGSSPQNIKLGGFDTTIQANPITVQYMEIDAGTIDVKEFWGSALDYAPFTEVSLFVPFVGYRPLRIEDIQNVTLAMKYHVDVLTGDCVAYLKCGQSVMYSWSGNCRSSIPVTSMSSDLLFKNITAAGAVGLGLATGNPASAAAGAVTGAINTATAKTQVQRSGDLGGSVGLMSDFVPYLIFHRPKQSLAKEYNKFKGYPANITYALGNLKGYTEVEHINLSVQGATDTELEEIKTLLQNGVII
jgi:hypothetical protein